MPKPILFFYLKRKQLKLCEKDHDVKSIMKKTFQPFHASFWKMTKHTSKILRCEHRKMFKVCLAIFQLYEWKG